MMTKRLLSLLLTLCIAVGSTGLAVYASEEETSSDTAAAAYELLSAMGITDGGTDYEAVKNQTVKRGEFALYLARIFNTLSLDAPAIFSDVDAGTERGKAVLTLASRGVFNGYEDGSFQPDNSISISEMAVASVRALGYTAYTAWEFSDYFNQAYRMDLLDGVKNTDITSMGDCIVLLYNVLHCEGVEFVSSGNELVKNETKSPLEKNFGLKYIKGIVTANAYAAINGERTSSLDYVRIDETVYKAENTELSQMLGYKVTVYVSTETDNIMYFLKDPKNTEFTIDADEFESFDGKTLTYVSDESNKTKRVRISTDAVIIKNSGVVKTDYESAFDIDYGQIKCISYDESDYDVIIIEAYKNYTVTGVDVGRKIIYTDRTDTDGKPVSINLDNKDYAEFTMIPYGKAVNENTIEPDDLISISESEDGKIIKGYLCADSVNGKIESISGSGTVYITINGTEYKADPYFVSESGISTGDSGEFIFDAGGRIAAFSKDKSDIETIGYVYKMYKNDYEDDIGISIYNVKREHVETYLANKVKLNGKTCKAADVKTALCTLGGGALKRQLVMYKLNGEGKVSEISAAKESKADCTGKNMLYTQLNKGSYQWYYQMKTFERKYVLSGGTYYMRVPSENASVSDKTLFGCQTFSNVTWYNSNASKSILGLYKFNDDTPYSDIMVVENTDGAVLSNQTEITVVSSVYSQIGPDGTAVTAIHGYRRGNEVTAYVPDDVYKNDVETGDIIRFASNVNGLASVYELVYDYSEDKVMWDTSTSTANEYTSNTAPVGGLRYVFGYVNDLYIAPYTTGLNSVIQVGSMPDTVEDIYQTNTSASSTTRFIIVDGERKKDKVYMGHLDEISAYNDCHSISDTSRVFVHTRSGWLIAVVIYK